MHKVQSSFLPSHWVIQSVTRSHTYVPHKFFTRPSNHLCMFVKREELNLLWPLPSPPPVPKKGSLTSWAWQGSPDTQPPYFAGAEFNNVRNYV